MQKNISAKPDLNTDANADQKSSDTASPTPPKLVK